MRSKSISVAILSGLLLIGGIGTTSAKPQFHRGHQTKQAKTPVTQEQAQAAALKKVPGTINDSKTETVKGKEVYWFDITGSKGQKEQVWVNSTGKVTKVTKEKAPKPMKAKTGE